MVVAGQYPRGENLAVIVVAAGSGSRFGAGTPKQFLPLKGKPVVVHALEAFATEFPGATIILVLSPDGGLEHWRRISGHYHGPQLYIVEGGSTRTDSVANALAMAERLGFDTPDKVVMIHDGARPIVNRAMLRGLYNMLTKVERIFAAVPAYEPTEAMARVEMMPITPVPRYDYVMVQTPQTFDARMIIATYRRYLNSVKKPHADDAAIFADFGTQPVYPYPGDHNNIKITRPADIRIAEILMDMPQPYTPIEIDERYLCLPPGMSI